MSELLKTNVYMLFFVTAENTENTEFIIAYENKPWYFTLDKKLKSEKYFRIN